METRRLKVLCIPTTLRKTKNNSNFSSMLQHPANIALQRLSSICNSKTKQISSTDDATLRMNWLSWQPSLPPEVPQVYVSPSSCFRLHCSKPLKFSLVICVFCANILRCRGEIMCTSMYKSVLIMLGMNLDRSILGHVKYS